MNTKTLSVAALTAPLILTLAIALGNAGAGTLTSNVGCLPAISPTAPAARSLQTLNPTQLTHATTIYNVSIQLHLPARAAIIALATALQESDLKNLANSNVPRSLTLPHDGVGSDHDSVGLFQQRPLPPDGQGGWGTVQQLMTPTISATKFYTKMRTIPGWQTLPLTVVAQRVQISAYPDAYAKHEPLATAIVNALTNGALTCAITISAQGWTQPVHGTVGSGFRTPDRPGHDGVDLIVPKGTPIHAAATGTVTTVRCNAIDTRTGGDWGCDRDGNPNLTRGCGWYIDIEHPGGIITRYCHQLIHPFVYVGQRVTAGQIIGISGSSGHSSGPHVHFEVHLGDHTPATAVDPVPFMTLVGAPLDQ